MSGFKQADPLVYRLRSGKPGDEFVTIEDEVHKIVNQSITLSEIPHYRYRVQLSSDDGTEWQEIYSGIPNHNQYIVNYSVGRIMFNVSREGETVSASFTGMGLIYIPSERVYREIDGNGDFESIEDYLESKEQFFNDAAIAESQRQANELQRQANESDRELAESQREQQFNDYLENAENEINDLINNTNNTVNTLVQNTEQAVNELISEAEEAIEDVEEAVATTQLIYKEPVATYNDIFTTYPTPQEGWTTIALDTGFRYRYDGTNWIHIDSIVDSVNIISMGKFKIQYNSDDNTLDFVYVGA